MTINIAANLLTAGVIGSPRNPSRGQGYTDRAPKITVWTQVWKEWCGHGGGQRCGVVCVATTPLGVQWVPWLPAAACAGPISGCWKDTGGLRAAPALKQQQELGWENQLPVKLGPGLPLGPVPRAPGNTMPLFVTWPAQGALPSLSPKNTNPSKGLVPLPPPSNANVPGLFS